MRRFAKIAVLAILSLEIIYVAGSSVFLNGSSLRRLINTSEDLNVNFRWAVSPLPGVVFVKGVQFRVQDSNMQFYFELGTVTVGISLPSLLHREFVTNFVDGNDLRFLFRLKRDAKAAAKLSPGVIAPLPGYPSLVKTPPGPDTGQEPWHVKLNRVTVTGIKELWFEEFRFDGSAHVKGEMTLYPGRGVEVRPSVLSIENGTFRLKGSPWAENLHLRIEAALRSSPKALLGGLDFLKRMRIGVYGGAELSDLSFVNYYLSEVPWLKFPSGSGQLETSLTLADGVFLPASQWKVHAKKFDAVVGRFVVEGSSDLHWETYAHGPELRVGFPTFKVSAKKITSDKIEGNHFEVKIVGRGSAFKETLIPVALDITIPKARLTGMGIVNGFLPRGTALSLSGGRGSLEGRLHADRVHKKDVGTFKLRAEGIDAKLRKLEWKANLGAEVKIVGGSIDAGRLEISGTQINLDHWYQKNLPKKVNAEAANKEAKEDSGWWAKMNFGAPTYVQLGKPAGVKGAMEMTARDAKPFFEIYFGAKRQSVPRWLEGILAFDSLKLSVQAAVTDSELRLSKVLARGDKSELKGWLNSTGDEDQRNGGFLLTWGPFAAGLYFEGPEVNVRLQNAIKWYDDYERRYYSSNKE